MWQEVTKTDNAKLTKFTSAELAMGPCASVSPLADIMDLFARG